MADALTVPDPALPAPSADLPLLDPKRLDVYRVAVKFQLLTAQLLPSRGYSAFRDQLERASLSIVLNIAEGAGRFSRPDKARFYMMARGSATECGAIVELLLARGIAPVSVCRRARSLLVRLVQMLTRLGARLAQ